MSTADKPIQILQDIEIETKTGLSNLSALLWSYVDINERKAVLDKQSKNLRSLIFASDHAKSLDHTNTYLLPVLDEATYETKEEFRLRSSSTTSVSVNKLLLLQYGLTEDQINAAVKEKKTKFWIVERVRAKAKDETEETT